MPSSSMLSSNRCCHLALGAILWANLLSTPAKCQGNSTEEEGEEGIPTIVLLKSHAVLMIAAWLGFAPLAILFARFQRDPLRRLFDEQLWFQVHRLFNTLTVLCALLAFFCIFSVVGGKWAGPRAGEPLTWGQMHALLGFLAVLLALSQPMTALFRCHPDSSGRAVFNIWHGISGYLAWLCAAGALIIACTTIRLFASPTVATVLIFLFLALLVVCFSLMQFLAIQKAQHHLVDWTSQQQLFAAAALLCVAFGLAISLLVIFA